MRGSSALVGQARGHMPAPGSASTPPQRAAWTTKRRDTHMATAAPTTYSIDGTLLEACSCMAPCPCWIGDDPDGGKCDAFLAYRIDKGSISGVDCSGVSFAIVALVPGNILKG